MTVREAVEADVPRVIEMAARFLIESQYGELFDNKATPEALGRMVEQVRANGTIFVAVDAVPGASERLIGMLAVFLVPHVLTGRIYADELAWWVEPEHRKGLIGPKMLRVMEQWATRNGANMVKMVAPAGSTVAKYYERSGFKLAESAYIKTI